MIQCIKLSGKKLIQSHTRGVVTGGILLSARLVRGLGSKMSNDDTTVLYPGKIVRETPKAYLADLDGDEPVWLPKSQVFFYEDAGNFSIPRWLAEKHDLPLK
jgi:hypothetical protein